MIRRAGVSARAARRLQVRGYATSSPSSKITVVPFGPSIEDAKTRMDMFSLLAAPSVSNFLYALLLKLFGPGFERYGREFGFGGNVKLNSLVPAYYPIWRVDAIAEGPVTPMRGGKESPAWLSVKEAYVPGNPFAPLSYLSFAVPELPEGLKPYNPSRDLRQLDGEDIVEIPFTVNPLAFIDKIRDRVGNSRPIAGGCKVNQSKWQNTMTAAYPVMFPIYIAEYEYTSIIGNEVRRFPLILDAHNKDVGECRPSFPLSLEFREAAGARRKPAPYFVKPGPFAPDLSFTHAGSETVTLGENSPEEEIAESYDTWMSPNPIESKMSPSPTLTVSQDAEIDWEDPRIQSWSSEERLENGVYLEKGKAVHSMFGTYQRMSDLLGGKGVMVHIEGPDGKTIEDSLDDGGLEKPIKAMQAELEECKPKWLVEYDAAKAPAAKA